MTSLYVIPLLLIISIVLALLSGRETGTISGTISYSTFDIGMQSKFNSLFLVFSFIKVYTFSFIISTVSAYYGYNVKDCGGAADVGRASIKAVVASCIIILIFDFIIASML